MIDEQCLQTLSKDITFVTSKSLLCFARCRPCISAMGGHRPVRKYRSTNAGRDHPHTSFEPSWTRFSPASEAFSSPASTTGVVPISPSEMLASVLDRAVIEVTVCRACQVCIALCLCGIEGEKISIAVARLRGACRALLRGYANRSHLPPFLKMASRCSLLFLKVVSR